jgi:hypothetical protein
LSKLSILSKISSQLKDAKKSESSGEVFEEEEKEEEDNWYSLKARPCADYVAPVKKH